MKHAGVLRDAIWFGRSETVAAGARMTYRLGVGQYNGHERVQAVARFGGRIDSYQLHLVSVQA